MDKIKIIMDTASDITLEEAGEHIELLPVTITVDGKAYRELYDISKEEYWKILEENENIPTTSQVTPEMFLKAYKKAAHEGYNKLIVVTINGKGSGTFNSANLAVSLFKEDGEDETEITVIDSTTYSYCYGRTVMNAAKMIDEGIEYKDICDYLKDILPHMRGVAYMSTLKFAKASGRISVLAAVVGDALGLKPIIKLGNGEVDVINKTRGEKAAISKLIEAVKEDGYDVENNEVVLVHGNNPPEMIEKAKMEIEEKLNPKAVIIGQLGCSITSNTGPQTIGILYRGK